MTGGPELRELYYRIRIHLGFSRQEWRKLPWHDQRMYLEELAADGKLDGTGATGSEVGLDDLAASGAQVTQI